MILMNLCCCYEKVFTHMNTWMYKKRVCKDFEIKDLGQ